MSITDTPRIGIDFPPQAVREYALLADGFRGALIGPRGDVTWLCAPVWDSPTVFAQLIGGRGVYAVTPAEPFVWGGYYEPGTLIWRSRWTTTSGTAECREALTYPGERERLVLLRRVETQDAAMTLDVVLDLAADFGRASSAKAQRDENGVWHLRSGNLYARWSGAAAAEPDADHRLSFRLELELHTHHDLVLEISEHALAAPVEADGAWLATEQRWDADVPRFDASADLVTPGMRTPYSGV